MTFEEAQAVRDKMFKQFEVLSEAMWHFVKDNTRASVLEEIEKSAHAINDAAIDLQEWVNSPSSG